MNKEEAKRIAQLARIQISDDEAEKIAEEMGNILEYVDKLKEVSVNDDSGRIESAGVRNIFVEDEEPHQNGINRERILNEAPALEGNLIKVKKIL